MRTRGPFFLLAALGALSVGCSGRGGTPAAGPVKESEPLPNVGPHLDFIQVDGGPAERFDTGRAVLTVPTSIANDPKALAKLLSSLSLKPIAPELPEQLRRAPKTERRIPNRQQSVRPNTNLLVSLSPLSATDADEVIARQFGDRLKFGSARGKQAFAAILKHRRLHPNEPLALDFEVEPTQLLTNTQEGPHVAGMAADGYWALTELRKAWPLALQADAPGSSLEPVTVAIVDQGFESDPDGLFWGSYIGHPNDFDKPAFDTGDGNDPWHGTHCGSVAGATVNNASGAAGSSLRSPKSVIPTAPKSVSVEMMAAAIPQGPVSMHDVSDMITRSIFIGGADVVSVSYSMWCGFFCNLFGAQVELEETLADAESNHVAVVFAAGNDARALPTKPNWKYLVGCQRDGKALCIGAANRRGERTGFSNFGESVVTFAPGEAVNVNPLHGQDPGIPRYFDGTSAAAPFMAGILGLMESAWGTRLSGTELRPLLRDASRVVTDPHAAMAVPVINATSLLRTRLRVVPDAGEPNDSVALVASKPPFALGLVATPFTLHDVADQDVFPIEPGAFPAARLAMNFVADAPGGNVTLVFGEAAAGSLREIKRTSVPIDAGHAELTVCGLLPQRYYAMVARDGTTAKIAYDLAVSGLTDPATCSHPVGSN